MTTRRNLADRLPHLLGCLVVFCASGIGTAAAQTTITRTSSFGYDPATGLLKEERIEPDTPDLCVLTVYGLDVAGNRQTQTVSNCPGATAPAAFTSRIVATNTYATFSVTLQNSAGTNVSVNVPTGTFPRSGSNALAHPETRTFDPRFGTPTQVVGPNALTTAWAVDEFGRRERETRADGTYTQISYCIVGSGLDTSSNSPTCAGLPAIAPPLDAVQFVHSQVFDGSGAVAGPYTRTFTDRRGREIRTVTQSFDGSGQATGLIATDIIYNPYGAKIAETQPYFLATGSSQATGSAPMGYAVTAYDVLGRPTSVHVTDPAGTAKMAGVPVEWLNGRFAASVGTGARTTYSYSALNVTVTNPKGQTSRQEKDPEGRLRRTTDAAGAQVAYLHDALGNLLKTRDGLGNETTAEFDVRGRRKKLIDPDTGEWRYTYNALGELVAQDSPKQRAAGQSTTMEYDVLGRMTRRTTPEFVTTWSYDKYANASACSKGIGKLCEVTTTHGFARRYTYDSLGRPTEERVTASGGLNGGQTRTFVSKTTYDAKGRVDSHTYPTNLRVNYRYTNTGFFERVENTTGSTVYWRAQRINAWGKLEQQLAGNNVQTRSTYQALTGRVSDITAGIGTATDVFNHRYGWDPVGNLSSRTDLIGAGTGSVTETFVYDSINRLAAYTVTGAAIPNGSRTVGVGYNAGGNILYKSDVGLYRYPVNGAARPHGAVEVKPTTGGTITYGYDDNGNVSSTASAGTATGYAARYTALTYTSFNLPDSSGGVLGSNGSRYVWQYDDRHARIKEVRTSASGTRTTWNLHPDKSNGLAFEQEFGETGAVSNRHYLSAGGAVVGVLVTNGDHMVTTATTVTKTEYWHKDHLGSSGAITGASGAVTSRYAYDPWGKRRFSDGRYDPTGTLVADYPGGSDRGFTGHEHLDDVGIVHMNGRTYDPHIGRFLQPDPLVQDTTRLQNFNRYSYVLNNPLNAVDPSGEFIDPIFAAFVIAISAYATYQHPEIRPVTTILIGSLLAPGAGGALAALGNEAVQVALAGFVASASTGGGVKGGLRSAATAMLFFGAGQLGDMAGFAKDSFDIGRVALHAGAGCLNAAVSGGDCGKGAVNAGLTKAMGSALPGDGTLVLGTVKYAVIGGTVEAIGGGKFGNGAVTGSFQYLFNYCSGGRCTTTFEQVMYDWWPGYKAGTLLYNQTLGDGSWTGWEVLDAASVGVGAAAKGISAGLSGGSRSAFWSGSGAKVEAAQYGTTLDMTPIGRALDLAQSNGWLGDGAVSRWIWREASAIFAGNAQGTAQVVIRFNHPSSYFYRIELPILQRNGVLVQPR